MTLSEILVRAAALLLALVFVLGGLATLRNPQQRAEQLVRFRFPFPILLVRLNAAVFFSGLTRLMMSIAVKHVVAVA